MDRQGRQLPPEEQQRWWDEAGRWQLRQLLFWRWDPIGINDDFPFTLDEYDRYAEPIGSLLGRGTDVNEIAAYLQGIEEDAMELRRGDVPGDHCHTVARLIADWHRNSIAHWQTR